METETDQSGADGALQTYVFYDGLGREVEASKQAGSQNIVVCKTWDGKGRLYQESNPIFSNVAFGTLDLSVCGTNSTSYSYDGLNRKLTVTAPDGSMWNYGYGSDSSTHTNRTAENDPTSHSHLQYFDAAGRLKQVDENPTSCPGISCGITGRSTLSTTYGYDPLDNLTGVTQGVQSRSFVYDSLKRLVKATNPESGAVKYKYDDSGNLATRTDANGRILTFGAWDGLNHMTSKSYSLGSGVAATPSVSYTYGTTNTCNQLGRLTQVTSGSQVNNYLCYDCAGRVTSNNQVTGGTTYSMSSGYDLAGELTSFTFPSTRQQTIAYDTGGRISGASGAYQSSNTTYASLTSSDAYFANGAIQHLNLGPNALVQQYCQNNRLQTTGVRQAPLNGAVIANCANSGSGSNADPLNLSIAYGAAGANNGNVASETIQTSRSPSVLNLTQNFTYDAYNRLWTASESGTPGWSQTYGHDAFGNHWVSNSTLALNVLTPQAQNWFDQTTNRILGTAPDNSGNQQQLGPFALTYDAENRMATAVAGSPLNLSVSYTYDGEGRRVSKSTVSNGSSYSTTYVYDASGALVAESGNEPANSGTLPTGTEYLTADHLGSTRMSTDASGNVIKRYDFLPFGEEIWAGTDGRSPTDYNSQISLSATQDAVNNKFTGKERDAETGLDWFGTRYFSGAQGRWTSPDKPFADQHPENPQSWNLYAYTTNNPLRFVDDNGTVKRDANGNVVFESTGSGTVTFMNNAPVTLANGQGGTVSVTWQANFGHIYADNGTQIEASQATSDMNVVVKDAKGNVVQQGGSDVLGSGYSDTADCHGTTFASGQVWVNNDQVPKLIKGDNYSPTTNPTPGDVGVYTQNGKLSTTVHSVTVNSVDPQTGAVQQVTSKGGITPKTQTTPAAGWSDPNAKLTYYHQNPPPPKKKEPNPN